MILEVWKNPFRMNRNYISDGEECSFNYKIAVIDGSCNGLSEFAR